MGKIREKTGIALGSGGSRGLAHISVLNTLKEMNVHFDYVSGASMGAVIGLVFCAGKLEVFKEHLLNLYKQDKIYSLTKVVISPSGFIIPEGLISLLEKIVPYKNIEDLPIPLSIICTDYYTGKPIAFCKGDIFTSIRASLSIPGLLIPIKYDKTILIDGGVSNAVPVDAVKAMGAEKIIAVNVNPIHLLKNNKGIKTNKSYTESTFITMESSKIKKHQIPSKNLKVNFSVIKKSIISIIESLPKAMQAIRKMYVVIRNKDKSIKNKRMFFPKRHPNSLPNFIEILWQTIDIMQSVNTFAMFEKCKPDIIIEPNVCDIFPMDFTKIPKTLQEGKKATSQKENEIKNFIK